MDPTTLSLLVVCVLVMLGTLLGFQIGMVMGLSGVAGMWIFLGNSAGAFELPFMQSLSVSGWYTLMVIPLFVALGSIAGIARITSDLFTLFSRWLGHIPGGLAIATIGTCATFSAISGSSIATSATMAKFAEPELRRFGYDSRLSLGSIVMGGTLDIIIPPSITLVMFAIFAQQSVGKQLVAGIVPGILLSLAYSVLIYIRCRLNPKLGPRGQRYSREERWRSVPPVAPFLIIISLVIGGISFGIWTPVESAAAGLLMVLALGLIRRSITLSALFDALSDAVTVSCSIMMIVIGSMIFSNYLAVTGVNETIVGYVADSGIHPFLLFCIIVFAYLVLGLYLEAASILALTVPLLMPVIEAVGWDPVWFGIVVVILMGIASVSPPVGLNLFAVKAAVPHAAMRDITWGAVPFWLLNIALLFLLYFMPVLVTWLPSYL